MLRVRFGYTEHNIIHDFAGGLLEDPSRDPQTAPGQKTRSTDRHRDAVNNLDLLACHQLKAPECESAGSADPVQHTLCILAAIRSNLWPACTIMQACRLGDPTRAVF